MEPRTKTCGPYPGDLIFTHTHLTKSPTRVKKRLSRCSTDSPSRIQQVFFRLLDTSRGTKSICGHGSKPKSYPVNIRFNPTTKISSQNGIPKRSSPNHRHMRLTFAASGNQPCLVALHPQATQHLRDVLTENLRATRFEQWA